jgi:signal transduction histidine kinase
VIRTGEPELIPEITEEILKSVAQSDEHLGLMRDIGLFSVMTVPLVVSGRTVAALTLASSESGRRYGPEDLRFAEDLARRAALAMENSRLYREVRHESDERKRALEAVRDLNEHLERRVRERTAQLEEITRELDAFASTVAHDLRAPLRVMKGFSEMLLEDYSGKVLDPAGQEYARKIDRASERMSGLVEDLLSYSRLSRQEVPIHSVELETAVDEVLQDMADELRGAKAEVTVEKPLPRVLGHGALLAQVLANLISNAVKFVPPQMPARVKIRAEREGSAGVLLWIEDNGIGIEQEYLDRIFGVFERLHTQDRYPGTGLGLAIVRRAIERMGGTVGVESVFGQGSRFWIRLRSAEESSLSGI